MSTRYKNPMYTARCMARSTPFRQSIISTVCKNLKREVHNLCGLKDGKSTLRNLSVKSVSQYSCKLVLKEIKNHAPTLYRVLKASIERPGRKCVYGLAATIAVLLKSRNKCMSLLQGVISVLLYMGHCSKQVSN